MPKSALRRTLAAAAAALMTALVPAAAQAAPVTDPFNHYDGEKPLEEIEPGTVLRERTVDYHMLDLKVPIKAKQLLYRSTGARGQATANVTTVLIPDRPQAPARAIIYGSAYDSLDARDEPSVLIAGTQELKLGSLIWSAESLLMLPMLAAGHYVIVPDTEGQNANFAVGPEYGMNTLDAVRAATHAAGTGVTPETKMALAGYSGGAISAAWAAEMAPRYAPDVNRQLVGATMGGLLVHPDHNLRYVEGSLVWAGVMPMALVGIARAYGIDLRQYTNEYGTALYDNFQDASIIHAWLLWFTTFKSLAKPEYTEPNQIPEYVEIANKLILGKGGAPTIPLMISQGAAGWIEGTPNDKPGIGPGDGVMIAGDVRTLARQYCGAGTTVRYREFGYLSHTIATIPWFFDSIPWLDARFKGEPAAGDCGGIAEGNPLDPVTASPGTAPIPTARSADEPPVARAAAVKASPRRMPAQRYRTRRGTVAVRWACSGDDCDLRVSVTRKGRTTTRSADTPLSLARQFGAR